MFKGYLLKINGYVFPIELIQAGSYKTTPSQIQDMDSYTDSVGKLHRNVLPHTRSKVEFNTTYLHLNGKAEMRRLLGDRVKLSVEYWNDEENDYRTGEFYVPDITYEIYRVIGTDIVYKPLRIALIEY